MNVLQAIEKMKELDNKIAALETAILKLDTHNQVEEIEMLNEIKHTLTKEYDELQTRLEKTQLVNVR